MPFSTSACFAANGSHLPSLTDTKTINRESEVLGGLPYTPGKPIANYHIENIILATSNTELAFPSSIDAK